MASWQASSEVKGDCVRGVLYRHIYNLTVLTDGKVRSVEGIVKVFDDFAKFSGLKISMKKSTMFLASVSENTRQAIENRFHFAMGLLPVRLPSKCIRKIERLCSAFLWSGPALSSTKAKLPWSEVCRPRSERGLGLRPLKEKYDVRCFKLGWLIDITGRRGVIDMGIPL
ncbi:uncharacterized protein LOC112088095 [Eutrema salsugineum]|uniref:uncharacterized protein LOC112088095 n=1 Tax=Eutrema salsugineum TaxID=72664 RepID=UPI000CED18D6|nr:uncharacterized protein LOC112088095 [Eutrema salsugineum]